MLLISLSYLRLLGIILNVINQFILFNIISNNIKWVEVNSKSVSKIVLIRN